MTARKMLLDQYNKKLATIADAERVICEQERACDTARAAWEERQAAHARRIDEQRGIIAEADAEIVELRVMLGVPNPRRSRELPPELTEESVANGGEEEVE